MFFGIFPIFGSLFFQSALFFREDLDRRRRSGRKSITCLSLLLSEFELDKNLPQLLRYLLSFYLIISSKIWTGVEGQVGKHNMPQLSTERVWTRQNLPLLLRSSSLRFANGWNSQSNRVLRWSRPPEVHPHQDPPNRITLIVLRPYTRLLYSQRIRLAQSYDFRQNPVCVAER